MMAWPKDFLAAISLQRLDSGNPYRYLKLCFDKNLSLSKAAILLFILRPLK